MNTKSVLSPILSCMACGSPDHLSLVLSLGHQSPANLLLFNSGDKSPVYPLALKRCGQCGHGQLTHAVSPDVLYKDYNYASGTSRTLNAYLEFFADECMDLLPPGSSVLEIACNDGSLLRKLEDRTLFTFGVDPAINLTDIARDKHRVRVKTGMWPQKPPIGPYTSYDLVIAQNVLAHGPEPLRFLEGIKNVLSPDGLCVIQTSQAHMLENGEFDTIYHEHYSYFTVSSMTWLASRAGLRLRAVREVSVHGGSFVFILDCPESDGVDISNFLASGSFVVRSEIPKFGSDRDYAKFHQLATSRVNEIRTELGKAQQEGKHIAVIGAAAKAVVVMNTVGILPHGVYDEADLKIGKWIPGIGKQIQALKEISDISGPVFAVIGAWNFSQELKAKVKALRPDKETEFLTYFPDIEVST